MIIVVEKTRRRIRYVMNTDGSDMATCKFEVDGGEYGGGVS